MFEYRKEIDGLRALAILPVILFHAGFEIFSGGYIGVDIFFVISGYLITSIILREHQNNNFSFINFYLRRARRILPMMFFIMALCLPFSWLILMPFQMKEFSQSLISSVFFFSNFFFWKKNGYFDLISEEKPLLHFWSLAVEEQYYIFFPIVIFFCFFFFKKYTFVLVVLGFILSLFISELIVNTYPSANFYLLPSRAWEILAGSIAAFIISKYSTNKNNLLSFLGLLMCIIPIFVFNENTPTPSRYTLIPVIGVFLIILYAKKNCLAAKILRSKYLVSIGLISYSIYLWHHPIFAFTNILAVEKPSNGIMFSLILLTLLLSFLSYKFIEIPFRKNHFSIKLQLVFLVFFTFIILFFSTYGIFSNGFASQRFNQDFINKNDLNILRSKQFSKIGSLEVKAQWALVGDSHADSFQNSFDLLLKKYNQSASVLTIPGCPIAMNLIRVDKNNNQECNKFYVDLLELLSHQKINQVLISSRFALYVHGERFDNSLGGIERGNTKKVIFDHLSQNKQSKNPNDRKDIIKNENFNFITELTKNDIKVFLIKNIPEIGWNVPKMLRNNRNPNIPRKVFEERNKILRDFYNKLEKNDNVIILKSEDVLCTNEKCFAQIDEYPMYYDNNHLSIYGANKILNSFENILFKH